MPAERVYADHGLTGTRRDRMDLRLGADGVPCWAIADRDQALHLAAMDPLSESRVVPRRGLRGADFRAARSITAVWTARDYSHPARTRGGFAGLLPS